MLTNAEMLSKLDSAMKGITDVSDLGDSVLQPQKFARFIQEVQAATKILPAARFINMQSNQTDIDRISFSGRISKSGKGSTGAHRSFTESDFSEPTFSTNSLVTNEIVSISSLRDDALRENIERGTLETTLLQLMGAAVGRDLEEYAIFGDTEIPYATDDLLSKSDNWVRLAANKVWGLATDGIDAPTAGDFDATASTLDVKAMFDAMLDALPTKYLNDRGDWRFYVDFETDQLFRDQQASRETQLGDLVLSQYPPVYHRGIQVEYVPLFERATTVDTDTAATVHRDRIEGRIAMLTMPDNMVWGVFHQVTIEPEREAKERRTDFVLTVEPDAAYEDENAVVVAMIDKADPTTT